MQEWRHTTTQNDYDESHKIIKSSVHFCNPIKSIERSYLLAYILSISSSIRVRTISICRMDIQEKDRHRERERVITREIIPRYKNWFDINGKSIPFWYCFWEHVPWLIWNWIVWLKTILFDLITKKKKCDFLIMSRRNRCKHNRIQCEWVKENIFWIMSWESSRRSSYVIYLMPSVSMRGLLIQEWIHFQIDIFITNKICSWQIKRYFEEIRKMFTMI